MPTSISLAYVRWSDSAVYHSQCHPDDLHGYSEMESCGWLVQETTEYVTLALDRCHGTDVRLAVCIPRVNVIEMRTFPLPG